MSMMLKKLFGMLSQLGVDATDSDEVRQEKNLIVAASIVSGSAALVWGVIYILQGEIVGGIIPILGGVVFYCSDYGFDNIDTNECISMVLCLFALVGS